MALLRLQEDRPRFCGEYSDRAQESSRADALAIRKVLVCGTAMHLLQSGVDLSAMPDGLATKACELSPPLERRLRVLSRTPAPGTDASSPVLRLTLGCRIQARAVAVCSLSAELKC